MVAKLSQTVVDDDLGNLAKTKSFTLDPSARLPTTSDTTAGVELRKTTNQYADGGDAPAWIKTETRPDASTAWSTSWARNVLGPNGDLALIQPNSGPSQIQITNLHGDVVTEIPNTTGAVTGIGAWAETSEYGLAKSDGAVLDQNYGWLGAKRRSTDTVGGLTLMGVRLYNATTGRFLSRDPVPGGNDNTYIYPADPINMEDISGEIGDWLKSKAKAVGKTAWKYKYDIALIAVPGGAGAAMAYRSYRTAKSIRALRKATKGQNVVTRTKTCTTRYCFGSGHGMGGPHVHRTKITKQGPQRPSVTKMTRKDARKGMKDLKSGKGKIGKARRRNR
jgi:RHS repeat-associated protein